MRYNQPKLRKALEDFIAESSKNGLLNALGAKANEIRTANIEDYLKTYYSASQSHFTKLKFTKYFIKFNSFRADTI